MSSGVGVSSEAIASYDEMKLRRKFVYIIYKISNDGKSIIIEKAQEHIPNACPVETYNTFIQQFPVDEGRFGVYDIEYETPADGVRNKLLFFMWAPDNSKIRSRMLYASSKASLRQRLDGIHAEIQATLPEELFLEEVLEKVAKGAIVNPRKEE
ncbi:uncharacterized protein BJ171DRAFT_494040 [Polychytrium aggregatum]|uniref:uncharacterized protein n=1 Tax=Polychytrium aggregatum TaxID=110093 RepID=UPI0022FF34C4|nr:uncharacterized protein BJ171DRAFT_494040 [Polychytrium aggregatum]KAI9207257.1 hypothetical protein BJ171DRAFT_494040 [Polychytrium aggregatum]